ncbi:MAG: hypothetical protein JWO18_719 [Microbacteriaceae bacterium]|nr:hypothetical protein [Microbacteriaceae bacterium]
MDSPIASLPLAAEQLRAEWSECLGAFLETDSTLSAQVESMTDAGLDTVIAGLGSLQRLLDAVRASVAGGVAHRSRPSLGGDGMAKRAGYARPSSMLADRWGITTSEAARLCDVGLATMERRGLDGQPLPARYPAVAAALGRGTMGLESAAAITRELELASLRCSHEARLAAEQLLVERAPDFTVEELRKLARLVRDRLDEDGAEPRDELRRQRRSLRISSTSDGLLHIDWYLDPADGGLVKAGIDAIVGQQLRRPCATTEDADLADAPADDRSLEQIRSDAGVEIFRHAATCRSAAGELPSITMVVRMTLESLMTGLGRAEVEGIDETISASRARQLAADSEFIPIVLGGRGEVLDVGASRRLFSRAQRIAFAERDGGCAFGGCNRPPSHAEAHHIEWWSKSRNSDLCNGILLCSHHHHRVHNDGWTVFIEDGIPYFVPPAHVDSSRRPRRDGRVDLARLRV